jgi:hypothetical protein
LRRAFGVRLASNEVTDQDSPAFEPIVGVVELAGDRAIG